MKPTIYPFSAIVAQEQMKLALLLAAVDWRISVLLRGDKGAGKTTTARALATLLPTPAPFINLPTGATEDRLLGGLHLERALKGEAVLKPGLLSEAHGGVLYVDEVNLFPAHLGDMLLDTASSGVNIIEREGLSASHPAEFVLLGSMNPEEGSLRPQLLDRFALAVDIAAPIDPPARQMVVERRIAFERNPPTFLSAWKQDEQHLRNQIADARHRHADVVCSTEILALISNAVCEHRVRSLRADLAAVRASIAYAALSGDATVQPRHVATVLPLVLAHRTPDRERSPASRPQPPPPAPQPEADAEDQPSQGSSTLERIFPSRDVHAPALQMISVEGNMRGVATSAPLGRPGVQTGVRRNDNPTELDLRATINHALRNTGTILPRTEDLHARVRNPHTGTRYLFVIDSSGSHAAQERMRLVKGAVSSLIERSFKSGDEIAIIIFRGASAQLLLEPTSDLQQALTALEYLPTGGRTPLAHALDLAHNYITPATILVLLTDGRTNVPLQEGDPWQDALDVASRLSASSLVIDTENSKERLGRPRELADVMRAEYVTLDDLEHNETIVLALHRPPSKLRQGSLA